VPERLTERSFSALRWGYAGYVVRAAASFASGIVLARLLGPKPFGQVAAATLAFGFANQLADGGFNSALVQAPEVAEEDIRFVFTVQLLLGCVLGAICAAIAPLIATSFRDPAIAKVLCGIAPVFVIQAFGQTSTALLKRQLAFRSLQTSQVTSYLIGYAMIGVVCAWLGAGVWSLVAGQLAQSGLYSIFVFTKVRHSILPRWSGQHLGLARYGIKITGANILNWSIINCDNACVGRAFGSAALGLYSRAYNTVSTPSDSVVSVWQQVLFAAASRAVDRRPAIRRAYLGSVSAITLILFPPLWTVAVCAPTVVSALYGSRWTGLVTLLPPLAVAMSIHSVMAMAGPITNAADQVKREVRAQFWSLIVAAFIFLVAARYSITAVAWAALGAYTIRFVLATTPTLNLLALTWADVLRSVRGSIGLGIATAFAGRQAVAVCQHFSLGSSVTFAITVFTALSTAAVLLLLAAHWACSAELLGLINQIAPRLPRMLSERLRSIDICRYPRAHGEV
jgi:PST family polysaccharide transporter